MSNIKNIIFDLGGVILNLDISRTERAFSALAGGEERRLALGKELAKVHFFDRFETGDIDNETFINTLHQHTGANKNDIEVAWSAMLLDLPSDRIDFLKVLSQTHRIFLFSNINGLHIRDFQTIVQQQHPGLHFDGLFEKAWYSHLIRHRKPNAEAFRFVLDDAGLKASETHFIDDNADNIAGAKSVGMSAALHVSNSHLRESLSNAIGLTSNI